jgi:SAM-dependent MidA family methyltransferase
MHACNAHYYATRDPLGANGDFTTAPEISQMFGELVGAALADEWARAGKPRAVQYVELGPGRGTLSADALRVMDRAGLRPDLHFVEISPAFREAQRQMHPAAHWHESLETIPPGNPLMFVANEFFDALPVRQVIGGVERRVTLTPAGLAFDRGGEIVEISPAREAVARQIAAQLDVSQGVALIIDYGHERSAPGETLQAVRRHGYAPVLANPGEQDLTCHVDFEALRKAASVGDVKVTKLASQSEWLERLGIDQRAEALAKAHPDRAEEIRAALDRLCNPAEMGELFKLIAIHSAGWPVPAGFD